MRCLPRPRTNRFAASTFFLVLVALAVTVLPGLCRAESIPLFGSFHLGMARGDVLALEGAYDCAESMGPGTVCMDSYWYLNQEWEADFAFFGQGLDHVTLRAPYSPELYSRAFAMLDDRHELVALQSEKGTLDLLELWRGAPGSDEASRRMTDFESRAMQQGRLGYVFLERRGVQAPLLRARSVEELLRSAQPGTRQAVLVLYREDSGREWVVLRFDVPLRLR